MKNKGRRKGFNRIGSQRRSKGRRSSRRRK
jgi:hypothetical protein